MTEKDLELLKRTRLIPAAEVGKPIAIPESECNQNPQPWQKRAAKLAKRARLFPTEREARRENARRALAEMARMTEHEAYDFR